MSGNDSKAKNAASQAAPGSTMTIQPFMAPHIQGLLAQQLAQGFGGDPASYISPLFQPMQVSNFAGGASIAPAATNAAKPGSSMGLLDQIMEQRRIAEAGGRSISKVSARPA